MEKERDRRGKERERNESKRIDYFKSINKFFGLERAGCVLRMEIVT